jgi:CheY-like chemotaxis protein
MDKIMSDPAFTANFPVLVMTASIIDAQADLTPYPTVIGILVKPFKTEKLVSTVQRTLGTEQGKDSAK